MRRCLEAGCRTLIPNGSRCVAHRRARDRARTKARGTTKERGYGAEWQKVRKAVLERDGYVCRIRGPLCTVHATTVDHVVAIARGGLSVMSNLRAACGPCNSSKGGGADRVRP